MACFDQRIDDQARGPLDGNAQPLAEASQPAHQLGKAFAVVCEALAIGWLAGGVDDAHLMGMHGPVQPDEDILAHGQTPRSCGMTTRVGRRGGKLINRRSCLVGVALHPGARRGLPAPCGLRVSLGPSKGKPSRQSPQGHGSRSIRSVVLLGGVNAADTQRPRAEHGLTTGCFAVVDNTLRGLTKGQRVVHNQAPWTTLRRSTSAAFIGELAL